MKKLVQDWLLSGLLAVLTAGNATANEPWLIQDHADDLRAQSCAKPKANNKWDAITLTASPVPLVIGNADNSALLPPSVAFAGGWHLQSRDRAFGGLSGLAVTGAGDLLSVSDTGRFFRLSLAQGTPQAAAQKASMRFSNPFIRPGKLTADAEGLEVQDGIAFVSFERNFRVLAFAFGSCPDSAMGANVARLPGKISGRRVGTNDGPEALWAQANGQLRVGYEQADEGFSIVGDINADGTTTLSKFNLQLGLNTAPLNTDFKLVGGDHILLENGQDVTAVLWRAYDRIRGNRNIIRLHSGGRVLTQWSLQQPMSVDNFEGIALTESGSGLRLYIISDDNFSPRQRTLLLAFDVTVAPPVMDTPLKLESGNP